MKQIVLIGASGFIGSALLNEALNRKDIEVIAAVRNPEKITTKDKNLRVEKLDIFSINAVEELVKGADAVISAYNPGWTNPNIAEDTLKGYKSIIEGVKKSGVSRLLIVGGAGSLYVKPDVTVIDAGFIPNDILPGVKALAQILNEDLYNEKELDWVFFSPAGIIEPGKRTGKYELGKNNLITDSEGNSKISVEDYAKAMIDELQEPKHHQERFTIGYN